jgi:recombination protein RecA
VKKNRFAPCLYSTEFDIIHNEGINKFEELVDFGLKLSVLEEKETTLFFQGNSLGNATVEARNTLLRRPDLALEIENQIRNRIQSRD